MHKFHCSKVQPFKTLTDIFSFERDLPWHAAFFLAVLLYKKHDLELKSLSCVHAAFVLAVLLYKKSMTLKLLSHVCMLPLSWQCCYTESMTLNWNHCHVCMPPLSWQCYYIKKAWPWNYSHMFACCLCLGSAVIQKAWPWIEITVTTTPQVSFLS